MGAIDVDGQSERLTVTDLVVRYGKVNAVNGVTLAIGRGEVVAIIGPNSAGKSSLLEAIGAKMPGRTVGGTVTFGGHAVLPLETRARWHAGIRLVPQGRQIYPTLSVADNIRVIAENLGVDWKNVLDGSSNLFPAEFTDRLKLRLKVPAGNLSGGEQQMLVLARALVGEARMLLLDEPALGFAPRITQEFASAIHRWADAGIGILITDQSLRRWADVVDRVYILVRGTLSEYGRAEESIDQLIARLMG